jgi:hypothetical protein
MRMIWTPLKNTFDADSSHALESKSSREILTAPTNQQRKAMNNTPDYGDENNADYGDDNPHHEMVGIS